MNRIPEEQNEPQQFQEKYSQKYYISKFCRYAFLPSLCLLSILFYYLYQTFNTPPLFSTTSSIIQRNFYITLEQAFMDQNISQQYDQASQDGTTGLETKNFGLKVNKIVWLYQENYTQNKEIDKFVNINLFNTNNFSSKDGFNIITVDQFNYTNHLSPQSQLKITSLLNKLSIQKNLDSNAEFAKQISKNQPQVKKRLIIYFLLLENGGIFIDNKLTLVESLSWLENVMTLPYINVGDKINSQIQPQCFGFFRQEYSSFRSNVNVKRQYQFEKKMHMFPSLEEEFLACTKGSEYLKRLIEAYLEILEQRDFSVRWVKFNKNESLIGKTNTKTIFAEGHLMANHAILQEHQRELDLTNKGPYRKLAIDDWGLVTMNSNLGLRKMSHYFRGWNLKRAYTYLTKLTIKELEYHTGPIRFIWMIDGWITWTLIGQIKQQKTNEIDFFVSDSFIDRYFLRYLPIKEQNNPQNELHLYKPPIRVVNFNEEQNKDNNEWNSLPKIFWIIWDSGVSKKSSFIVQLCVQNLRRSAQNSGFVFNIVTKQNVHTFLSEQILNRIDEAVSRATLQISRTTISDIWRLALLKEHGGIYVDTTTFTMEENYDWVTNITRIPSNLIWNRFGKEPKVFMFWNTYYGHPMDWKYDEKLNIKKAWHLSYESNFIAAVNGSQLIQQWFDVYLEWIVTPYENVQSKLKSVNIFNDRWTRPNAKYLLVMDVIKYVLGKRQKVNENKDVSEYYEVWSMSGQMIGQQKFRGQSNFQNDDYRNNGDIENLIYRFQYSLDYFQSVNGQSAYQSKLFGQGRALDKKFLQFYHQHRKGFRIQKFNQILHPDSLLGAKLIHRYPQQALRFLSYYENLERKRVEFKGHNFLGF